MLPFKNILSEKLKFYLALSPLVLLVSPIGPSPLQNKWSVQVYKTVSSRRWIWIWLSKIIPNQYGENNWKTKKLTSNRRLSAVYRPLMIFICVSLLLSNILVSSTIQIDKTSYGESKRAGKRETWPGMGCVPAVKRPTGRFSQNLFGCRCPGHRKITQNSQRRVHTYIHSHTNTHTRTHTYTHIDT